MALVLKEEIIRSALERTALKYGGLKYYTWCIHTGNLFLRILLFGGIFQNFVQRYYFVGITESHLILQRCSAFHNPKGEPIVNAWAAVKVSGIKDVMMAKMVFLQLEDGKKLRLRILNKFKTIANYEEHREQILENFKNRLLNGTPGK